MRQGKGFLEFERQEISSKFEASIHSTGCHLGRVGNNCGQEALYFRKHYEGIFNRNRSCWSLPCPADMDFAFDGRPDLSEQRNVLRWRMKQSQANASGRKRRQVWERSGKEVTRFGGPKHSMCTLTWNRVSSTHLEIYFNRDELKTRPVADAPTRFNSGDSSFLSPRDPKGGGTWMLANDQGVVICLLNKWELEGRVIGDPLSRGRLVWSMARAKSPDEVATKLIQLTRYQAFTLAVFSPAGDVCWEWTGDELAQSEMPEMLTSSSFRFEEVSAARRASFSSGLRGVDFHASPQEPPSPYSVRMNRPDAQTWSRSRVLISDRILWHYLAEQADLNGDPLETLVELPLK